MRTHAPSLFVSLLLAGSAWAQGAPHPPEARPLTRPQWTALPSDGELSAVFPREARLRGIGGRAVLDCKVSGQGALSSCTIVEETPKGMGFGMAGLRASSSFRMRPTDRDGNSVAGGIVRVPVDFKTSASRK